MRDERFISCRLEVGSPFKPRSLISHSLSQRAGISYERRVLRYLATKGSLLTQADFVYRKYGDERQRMAILDGIRVRHSHDCVWLEVIEVKNQLNEVAYKQLDFYVKLVRFWANPLQVNGLLICNEDREIKGQQQANKLVWSLRELKRLEREATINGLRGCSTTSELAFWPGGRTGHGTDSNVRVPCLGKQM